VRCGEYGPDVTFVSFDVNEGGVHCRNCRTGTSISAAALAIMRDILGGRLNEALALDESPATHEVSTLATRALEHHIERRLKAVAMFEAH
jgi:DNA repair protein RecO (recombination protein O)